MMFCPFCNSKLKLVLLNNQMYIQRVVYLREGHEGEWNVIRKLHTIDMEILKNRKIWIFTDQPSLTLIMHGTKS